MSASTPLTVGSRWRSTLSDTEVIVVRATSAAGELACGGAPMVPAGARPEPAPSTPPSTVQGTTVLGKRYSDPSGAVEVLCTKGGAGTLSIDGTGLAPKEARALPASD